MHETRVTSSTFVPIGGSLGRVLSMTASYTEGIDHWGTSNLAFHDWAEPAETSVRLANEKKLSVLTPRIGEVLQPAHEDGSSPWWKTVQKGKG